MPQLSPQATATFSDILRDMIASICPDKHWATAPSLPTQFGNITEVTQWGRQCIDYCNQFRTPEHQLKSMSTGHSLDTWDGHDWDLKLQIEKNIFSEIVGFLDDHPNWSLEGCGMSEFVIIKLHYRIPLRKKIQQLELS